LKENLKLTLIMYRVSRAVLVGGGSRLRNQAEFHRAQTKANHHQTHLLMIRKLTPWKTSFDWIELL
jgi:hypothetical protein